MTENSIIGNQCHSNLAGIEVVIREYQTREKGERVVVVVVLIVKLNISFCATCPIPAKLGRNAQ